jgi:S1-C subfamily serine protease
MDLTQKWKITHQSICRIKHLGSNGKIITSGTGFKIIGNKILTNNHVFACPNAVRTVITFFNVDGVTSSQEIIYDQSDFNKLLIIGDPIDGWDFALLTASDFNTIPGLYLSPETQKTQIGSDVYFLGFPLQSESLTIHSGNISAKYKHSSGIKYIQIDGSINAGNSGGPLIDLATGCVIGLITRKNTGLTEKFSELKDSFQKNMIQLENKGASISIGGVDPVHALKITQSQLDLLSDEISRSSNVGIGYAFELDEIRQHV